MPDERFVAVGLLTQTNLDMLGRSLREVYPIEDAPRFGELLRALDKADRERWPRKDRLEALQRLRG